MDEKARSGYLEEYLTYKVQQEAENPNQRERIWKEEKAKVFENFIMWPETKEEQEMIKLEYEKQGFVKCGFPGCNWLIWTEDKQIKDNLKNYKIESWKNDKRYEEFKHGWDD